jgi:hypothetical protein
MLTPLFNTQNQEAVNSAISMLKFPHKYFANPGNLPRLKQMFEGNKPVEKLIDALNRKQLDLAQHMDFSEGEAEGFKRFNDVISDNSSKYVGIYSEFSCNTPPELTVIGIDTLSNQINLNISELINDQKVKLDSGKINDSVVTEIINVAWIVQHFALLTVGTLKLEETGDGSLIFKQKHQYQLRSTWFGNAFESMSLDAAKMSIASYAVATHQKDGPVAEDIKDLHYRVLSIIPHQWRLGVGNQLSELFHEICDLIIILVNIIQRNMFDEQEKPLSKGEVKRMVRQHPERKGLLKTYDLIKEFQKKNKPEDRLFQIRNGGLTLGPLKVARGLIQQIEFIALKKQGKEWHSKLEHQQTRFVLDDLYKCEHLDVLEFDFNTNNFNTSDFHDLILDVDFFIRDKSVGNVYAVQLKHVTAINEAGILSWMKLIANKKSKLNKGVLQLERLNEVITNSQSARDYLTAKGLSDTEIMNLKPIVVHNMGSLDCIPLHNGICLYDLYTFKKVLSGCKGLVELYKDGNYESSSSELDIKGGTDISNPNNVIENYLKDPQFEKLKYFDSAKYINRSVNLGEHRVVAEGIAI